MPLTDEDIRLVRASLPEVRERLRTSVPIFYDNLFVIAPDMRPLFAEDLAGQGMKFMSAVQAIADLLDDREGFDRACTNLARLHTRVGVRPEHFGPMGMALRVTLGETLGRAFTLRLQQAWHAAYEHITAEMIARSNR